MLRVRLFAVATIALSAALAGCSSSGSTSDLFKSSPPPPQVIQFQSVPAGANVQTAQGQTCSTPCSLARAGDKPGGFVHPERLRAADDSARRPPGRRLLVQHAAAGSCPQSGCRCTPGGSAPGSAPAQGQAEAAQDGRSTQACARRGRHRCKGRRSRRSPPRSNRRRKTMCSRLRRQRRHRPSRRRRRRDNAAAVGDDPTTSGKIMDDQGFIRHIRLPIS